MGTSTHECWTPERVLVPSGDVPAWMQRGHHGEVPTWVLDPKRGHKENGPKWVLEPSTPRSHRHPKVPWWGPSPLKTPRRDPAPQDGPVEPGV